jgi:hypothetical protein
MDIIFNCPKCDQELSVDASGSGSELNCPTCGETIVVPQTASHVPGAVVPGHDPAHPVHSISSSAAAKVEMHLKVPVRDQPSESLIAKPLAPLEAVVKDTSKHIRVKTIRHTDCIEVGHDKFDEIVTRFLERTGEENIISINTFTYTHLDIGTQKLMTEFGVIIVYRG